MNLPETGFVRLSQLIGQSEVTPEKAEYNRKNGKRPRTPRPAIPPIIPWSKSKIYDAIQKGEFPAPVKLSEKIVAWNVETIRDFIEKNSKKAA